MEIEVRRAAAKDIHRILELLTQVCAVHHEGRPDIFRDGARKYHEGDLKILLEDSTRPVFVGTDSDGNVLGYGFCIITETRDSHIIHDMKTLYIDDLCVDEKYRGRGIGGVIYNYIKNYARDIGCYHLTLNVWACNPSAMKFYEAQGLTMLKKEMEVIL